MQKKWNNNDKVGRPRSAQTPRVIRIEAIRQFSASLVKTFVSPFDTIMYHPNNRNNQIFSSFTVTSENCYQNEILHKLFQPAEENIQGFSN